MRLIIPRTNLLWVPLLFVAAWWPSRFIGPLDGVPLDRPLEAIFLGLALPWLVWAGRDALQLSSVRALVVALLVWKAGTAAVATQQGFCATTQAPHPVVGSVLMRIEEPRGYLRSWDLRADLWGDVPACTAILTRSFAATDEFPAWFLNITDHMIGRREFTMQVRGYVTRGGESQPFDRTLALGPEEWSFNPVIDAEPAWDGLVTTSAPSALDRGLAPWAWLVAPGLCLSLVGLFLRSAVQPLLQQPKTAAWILAGTAVAIALTWSPLPAVHRAAGLLAIGALIARGHGAGRPIELAAWSLGAPWLAFFAASSADLVGRFSAYSMDDWLAYQVAGYRIYMNGYWLEGGTATFDYQALYRWITGALHLVFGDSSVGEVYWDASCLLIGALVAFAITRERAGFRWGIAAGALVLMTLTLGQPWYLIGRGLSEISAAGFGFLAVASVMRSQDHGARWIGIAAGLAGLMFYARVNQLLWAPMLIVMVLPLTVGSDVASVRSALGRVPWMRVAMYLGGFAIAVLAFMTRTLYFTGVFSLFHGTALRHNDTGLRPWTLLDGSVWQRIGHSLMGFVFMNEPPRPDVRGIVVAAGIAVAVLAALQFPVARRVPAALVVVTLGGVAGAFVAHSHGYPGRFTVHLLPFASALTAIAASIIAGGFTVRRHRPRPC